MLKNARKQERGEVVSTAAVIALLQEEMTYEPSAGVRAHGDAVRERISVVVDALAFHAGEICQQPETIHGVIRLLSEIRNALSVELDDD